MRPLRCARPGGSGCARRRWAAGALAFPAVDPNHDGVVTWEEAHREMPRLARVHFEKCDPNGDGLIDRGEYPLLQTFYWMNYVDR